MSNLDLVHQAFVDTFPAKGERASLEYVEVVERKQHGELGVVIRLVVWDVNKETGVQSIRDVKEQECYLKLPGLDLASVGRLRELLGALANVLPKALDYPEIETFMPHDLLDFSPLKLVKAQTEADFIAALSVPSRLGRYMTNPA